MYANGLKSGFTDCVIINKHFSARFHPYSFFSKSCIYTIKLALDTITELNVDSVTHGPYLHSCVK